MPCSHKTFAYEWYIAEHREEHNHSLSPTFGQTIHWPSSHKHIDVYSRDLVKQLRQNNVNLPEVYNIIGSFFGRMENVPFTKRALLNLRGKINRDKPRMMLGKQWRCFRNLVQKINSSHIGFKLTKRGGSTI